MNLDRIMLCAVTVIAWVTMAEMFLGWVGPFSPVLAWACVLAITPGLMIWARDVWRRF